MDITQRIIEGRVPASAAGETLSAYLARRFTYREEEGWRERVGRGEIVVNGESVPADRVLAAGDLVRYTPSDIVEPPVDPTYRVVFEDEALLVIDKSGDLPVHPAGVFYFHTLWYLLTERFGEINLVNRLDRETSGLMAVAKNAATAAKLSKRPMEKRYWAIVHGEFPEELAAEGFLVRDAASPVRKKRRFVCEPGEAPAESARTFFRRIDRAEGFSLVEATLGTGRMHQIRATLCSLGYPLVGDKLYGVDETIFLKIREDRIDDMDRARLILPRQALHSRYLKFAHPASGEMLEFGAELPADLEPLGRLFRTQI